MEPQHIEDIKVFWFFFSKKNILAPSGDLAPIPLATAAPSSAMLLVMNDEREPDLALTVALLRQVIAEQATARDDIRVLTAIALRQDSTLAALLTEIRAMHAQHSRMDNRLRALEAQ